MREDADGAGTRWLALAAMLLAAAMDLIDTTIVNVALPQIRGSLHADASAAEWVVAGYALAFGAGLITGGRLGDAFGRRRVFLAGTALFMAASLLCAMAPAAGVLIAGRLVQGLAAALMIPQVLTVIQVSFTDAERPKAYAAYGACAAIATVSGPLLGGVLVQADLLGLGWRPVFGINVALGLAAVAGVAAWLPESRAGTGAGLDLPGMALLAAALSLLLYPLTRAPQDGWSWPDAALLAAGAAALAVFGASQRLRRDRHPLVPARLLAQRGLAGGVAAQLALYAGVTGFFLVFALTLESGYRLSPLRAGLMFLPFSAGIAAASAVSGQLAPRLGRRLTMAGALAMAAGMAGLLAAVRFADPVPGTWPLIPGLLLAGTGMGLAAPTLAGVSLAEVDPRDAGPGSGVVATAGQAGGALGVALIGTVFFGTLHGTPGSASGYTTAFTAALGYETGVFLLAAVVMLALPRPAAQARTAARETT